MVYIALGTIFNLKPDFYRTCMAAFQASDLTVAMSVGNNIDIGELGPIPANFIVAKYLPQLEILKLASAFISHAGMNSCSEGIYYKVPLVLFPQAQDQYLMAERIAELGAGFISVTRNITPAELRKVTEMVIADHTLGIKPPQSLRLSRQPGQS